MESQIREQSQIPPEVAAENSRLSQRNTYATALMMQSLEKQIPKQRHNSFGGAHFGKPEEMFMTNIAVRLEEPWAIPVTGQKTRQHPFMITRLIPRVLACPRGPRQHRQRVPPSLSVGMKLKK